MSDVLRLLFHNILHIVISPSALFVLCIVFAVPMVVAA